MSDKKTTELPDAAAITGTELIDGVQGGVNVKATVDRWRGFDPSALIASINTLKGQHQALDARLTTDEQDAATIRTDIAAIQARDDAMAEVEVTLGNRITALEGGTPPAVPNAPTALHTTYVDDVSVRLAWTASTTGSPTSYQVQSRTATGAWMNAGSAVSVTNANVTGLAPPGATYQFQVYAINGAGPGPPSASISVTLTNSGYTPSPAWTEMPPATSITMDDGGVVTLESGIPMLTPLGGTKAQMGNASVVNLIVKADTGRIFDRNQAGGWWYWDPTQANPWVATGDPRNVVPVSYYLEDWQNSGDLQSTRTVQPGDKWQLIDAETPDGRGGPANSEDGSHYWANIYTPGFSAPGLYSVAGGRLRLGVMATPSGIQAAVDAAAGAHMPFVASLVNSTPSYWLPGKYHEILASVPRVPGVAFQACLEAPSSVRWPPEIDIQVYTNADNNQYLRLAVCRSTSGGGFAVEETILQPFGWNGANDNTYACDLTGSTFYFYLNGTQIWSTPKPTQGGDYDLNLMWYLLSATGYAGDKSDPNPASLPVYALVGPVRIYNSKPGSSTTTTTSTTTTSSGTNPSKTDILNFVNGMAGNHVMIGQYVDLYNGPNKETDEFTAATGKHVAIRSDGYWPAWNGTFDAATPQVNANAIAHWNAGGLVQINSYPPDPVGGDQGLYGGCTPSEVITPGSAQYNYLFHWYDQEITGLLQLKAAGLILLYRPCQENRWNFWWGFQSGNGWTAAQWITMWQQRYDYYMSRGCDHLIWMFIQNLPETYPGDRYVDMVGEDVYADDATAYIDWYNEEITSHPTKGWCMGEWGNGDPGHGYASYDARRIISDIKNSMPKTCFVNAWLNAPPQYVWGWGALSYIAEAMNDSYVKVRENLGRPAAGTITTTPAPTTTPGPTTTSAPGTSPNGTLIHPGSGTITDNAGNVFSINTNTPLPEALMNSAPIPGGAGTAAMEWWNGQIYGQDQDSGDWYTLDVVSQTWTYSAAGPGGAATTTPAPTTTPPPTGGPGHGPALAVPSNAQVFPGRSNGTQWGNIRVSTGVSVNTTDGEQYGNINYSAIEINTHLGWAEFGRYGEIKNLYMGCTAVFFTEGIVLGPPDVALTGDGTVYYTVGNYTGGAIIWSYATMGNYSARMVINDFSRARGDILSITDDGAARARGVTITHPSWGTLIQLNGTPGQISLYGVTLNAADVGWA